MSIPVEVRLTPVNHTKGREGLDEPDLVVFHHWGEPALYRGESSHESVVDWFHRANPDGSQLVDEEGRPRGSSAHVVGSYLRRSIVVEDADTAWHAGNWPVNVRSLGFEAMPFDASTPYAHILGTFLAAAEQVAVWRVRHPSVKGWTIHRLVSTSGTECPGAWERLAPLVWEHAERLMPYVDPESGTLVAGAPTFEGVLPVGTMVSPVEGRMTSAFGPRAPLPYHTGMDLAPPVPGTPNWPVRAAFAGKVVRTVSTRKPGDLSTTNRLSPHLTGNGAVVENPDTEMQAYGHVRPVVVVGQQVRAGQLIGYIDLSGNTSGYHCHFETWRKGSTVLNPDYANPQIWFDAHGIKPGSKPVVDTFVETNDQTRLILSGHYAGRLDNTTGPMWDAAVRSFQTENKLVVDGEFGKYSRDLYDAKYMARWTDVQRKLAVLKQADGTPYYEGVVDGIGGKVHYDAVGDFQGDRGLAVDHVWGPVTAGEYAAALREQETPTGGTPVPSPEPPAPTPVPEPTPGPEPVPEPPGPLPEPPAPEPSPGPVPEPVPEEWVDAVIEEIRERLNKEAG